MDAKMSEEEERFRAAISHAEGRQSKGEGVGVVSVFLDECKTMLSELDRLREFSEEIREAHTFILDHNDFDDAVTKAIEKLDARATGGEGT